MDATERGEILKQLSAIQTDTSSVTVQIGGVKDNGQVDGGSLYIKNAPARITKELAAMGYSLSVSEEGVRVGF